MAISRAQTATPTQGNSTSPSVTYGSTPTEGNLLVAMVNVNDVGRTITPPAGWSSAVLVDLVVTTEVFWKVAGASEPTAVNFTFGGASERWICFAAEWSGISDAQLDATNTAEGNSATATSGQVTPTASIETLLVSAQSSRRGNPTGSTTNSFTFVEELENAPQLFAWWCEKITATPGTEDTDCALESSREWVGTIAAFQANQTQVAEPALIDGGNVFEPGITYVVVPDLIDGGNVFAPSIEYQAGMPIADSGDAFEPGAEYHVVAPLIDGSGTFAPSAVYPASPVLIDTGNVFEPSITYEVAMPLINEGDTPSPTATMELDPVLSKVGTFTTPAATGNLDVTGFGLDPVDSKAFVLFWGQTLTTNDTVSIHDAAFVGFAEFGTANNRRCVVQSGNNSSDDCQRRTDTTHCIYGTTGDAPTTRDFSATTVEAITDGMRINFDNVDGGAGFIINYMVIAGADVANVHVGHSAVSAGSVSGLGFEPDLLFGATICYSTLNAFNGDGYITVGAAANDGSESQWTTAVYGGRTGGTGNDNKMSKTESGKFLRQMHGAWEQTVTTFDVGGFSWSGSDGDNFIYAAIEFAGGKKVTAGTYAKSTGAAPDVDTGIGNLGFDPAGIFMATGCELASAADADDNNKRLSIGASDGSSQATTLCTGINLGNNKRQVVMNDRVLAISQELAAQGIEAEGSMALSSEPATTWNPNDSQASEIGYVAWAKNNDIIVPMPLIDQAKVFEPSGTQFMNMEDWGDLVFLVEIANPGNINDRVDDGLATTCTWTHSTEPTISDYLMYDGVDAATGKARYRARLKPSGQGTWDLSTSGAVSELAGLTGQFFVKAPAGDPFKDRGHFQRTTGENVFKFANGDLCAPIGTLMGAPAQDVDVPYVEYVGAGTITFNDNGASPDTIVRSTGSWLDGSRANEGFGDGQTIVVTGSPSNDGTYTIDTVTADTITLDAGDSLTQEGPTSATVASQQKVTWGGFWNHVPSVAASDPELGSVNTSSVSTEIGRMLGKNSDHGFPHVEIMVMGSFFNNGTNLDPNGFPSTDDPISLQTFRALEYFCWECFKVGVTVTIVYQPDQVDGNAANLPGGYNGAEDARLQNYLWVRIGPIPGVKVRYGYDVWEWDGGGPAPPYPIADEASAFISNCETRCPYDVLIGVRNNNQNINDVITGDAHVWELELYKPGASVSRSLSTHFGYDECRTYDPTGAPGRKPTMSADQHRLRPQDTASQHYVDGETYKLIPYAYIAGLGAGGGIYADQTTNPQGLNGHPQRVKTYAQQCNWGGAPSNNYPNPTDYVGDPDERLRIRKVFGWFEWGDYHYPSRKYSATSVPRLGGIYTDYTEDGPTSESGTVCLENGDGKYVLYVENSSTMKVTLDATGLNMTATEVPGIAMKVDADGEPLGTYISIGTIARGTGEQTITLPSSGWWLVELNVDFLVAEPELIDGGNVFEPNALVLKTALPSLIDGGNVFEPTAVYIAEPDLIDDGQVPEPSTGLTALPELIDGGNVFEPIAEYHVAMPTVDGGQAFEPGIAYQVAAPLIDGGNVFDPGTVYIAQPDAADTGQVFAPAVEYHVVAPLIDTGNVFEPAAIIGDAALPDLIDGGNVFEPTAEYHIAMPDINTGSTFEPGITYVVVPELADTGAVLEPTATLQGGTIEAFPDLVDGGNVFEPTAEYRVALELIDDGQVFDPTAIVGLSAQPDLIDGGDTFDPGIEYQVAAALIDGGAVTAPELVRIAEPPLVDGGEVLEPLMEYHVFAPLIDGSAQFAPVALLGVQFKAGAADQVWAADAKPRTWVADVKPRKWEAN